MTPFDIIKQVLPRARSEEDFIELAASMGDPPLIGNQPPASVSSPASARLQGMPNSVVAPQPEVPVPPMTMGESRTIPRLGESLLGV